MSAIAFFRRTRRACVVSALALGCGSSTPTPATTQPAVTGPSAPTSTSAVTATADAPRPAAAPGYKVVGYFTNWVENRKGCEFRAKDVDPSAFTHINFAFAEVHPGPGGKEKPSFRVAPYGEGAAARDLGPSGLYAQVNALKAKNPALKTLISVGGWSHTDPPMAWLFTTMAETAASRGEFIASSIKYVRDNGFDGIDIDWEYPADPTRGGRPVDTKNFTLLMKEFRDAIATEATSSRRAPLLLTIATPAGKQSEFFELAEVQKHVDWINLMTYDFAGSWDPTTGMNAPNSKTGPGVQTAVATYLAAGVPADKLVLGMPTYGKTFAGVETDKPKSPHKGKGPKPRCTGEPGSISYFEVEELLKSGKFRRFWDDESATPYAYDPKTKVWVTYDDKESFEKKLDVLQQKKLAGAMFWAIDLDDYKGGYPLISTVKNRLLKK